MTIFAGNCHKHYRLQCKLQFITNLRLLGRGKIWVGIPQRNEIWMQCHFRCRIHDKAPAKRDFIQPPNIPFNFKQELGRAHFPFESRPRECLTYTKYLIEEKAKSD